MNDRPPDRIRIRPFFARLTAGGIAILAMAAAPAQEPPDPPRAYLGKPLRHARYTPSPGGGHAWRLTFGRSGEPPTTVEYRWIQAADPGHSQAWISYYTPLDTYGCVYLLDDEKQVRIRINHPFRLGSQPDWIRGDPLARIKARALPWDPRDLGGGEWPVGRIRGVRGEVRVGEGAGSYTLRPGDPLLMGDEIRTGPDAAMDADLVEGFRLSPVQDQRLIRHEIQSTPDDFFEAPRQAFLQVSENSVLRVFPAFPFGADLAGGWARIRAGIPWADPLALKLRSHGYAAELREGDLLVNASESPPIATFYLQEGSLLPNAGRGPNNAPVPLTAGFQASGSVGSRLNAPLPIRRELTDRRIRDLESAGGSKPQEPVARISGGDRGVYGVRGDGSPYRLQRGQWLTFGQTVETGPAGWALVEVSTPDGMFSSGVSRNVQLGPRTSIRLLRRALSPTGLAVEAFAEVVEGISRWWSGTASRREVIAVGDVLVEIRGTDFLVRFDRATRSGEVMLKEGEVVLHPKAGGPPVALPPGQRVAFSPAGVGAPVAMGPVEYDEAAGALTGGSFPQFTEAHERSRGSVSPGGPGLRPATPAAPAAADPFAPVAAAPPAAPGPVASPAGSSPTGSSSPPVPTTAVRWIRRTIDDGYTLDLPEDWVDRSTPEKVRYDDPTDPLTTVGIGIKPVDPGATLESELDTTERQTREQRKDARLDRTRTFFAGLPAEQIMVQVTLPEENRRVVVAAYVFIADGRRYIVQAQCPEEKRAATAERIARIVSSFSFLRPRGESGF